MPADNRFTTKTDPLSLPITEKYTIFASFLARRVNRRLAPGVMSVPRGIRGAVRVHIGEPKDNEVLYRALRDICCA